MPSGRSSGTSVWMVVVVMRVTTLKASAGEARRAARLLRRAGRGPASGRGRAVGPVDYYLDPDEPPGRWWGAGRDGARPRRRGDRRRAAGAARGPSPGHRQRRWVGRSATRRRGAFDATFSAPKSVSVLWALTPDPWVRAEVLAAHDAAVDAALGWFETHGAVTRRGTDGVHQVDTLGVTVARVPPAHLPDGRPAAAHPRGDRRQGPGPDRPVAVAGRPVPQVPAAHDRLGLRRRPARRAHRTASASPGNRRSTDPSTWPASPSAVREVFSQRSAQVEAKLAELIRRWSADHDGAEPDPRTIAQPRTPRRTRVPAGQGPTASTPPTLHADWVSRGRGGRVRSRPRSRRRPTPTAAPSTAGATTTELVAEALRRVVGGVLDVAASRHRPPPRHPPARRATATAAELVAEHRPARRRRRGTLRRARTRPARRPCAARDGRPVTEHVTDRRFTTRGDPRPGTRPAALGRSRRATVPVEPTDDPRPTAAEAIAGTHRLVLVVGPAGTGKTTTTARAVAAPRTPRAARSSGSPRRARPPTCSPPKPAARPTPWPGSSPATRHATVTVAGRDDGDPRRGRHGRHRRPRPPRRPRPTPPLAARRRRRPRTSSPPSAAAACSPTGATPSPTTNSTPHAASTNPGKPPPASPCAPATPTPSTPTPTTAGSTPPTPPSSPATSPASTHRDIDGRAHRGHHHQHRRHGPGDQPGDPTTHRPGRRRRRVALADGTHAGVGDQIATRRNDPDLRTDRGEQVRNRHTWTVTAVDPDGALTVTHPDRGTVTLPADYVARHVELGWAVTGYGNQGDTVDIGIAVLEPGTTRNHAYVALTRGRHTQPRLASPTPPAPSTPPTTRRHLGFPRNRGGLLIADGASHSPAP